jgi:hypothetical protein
MCYRFDICVKLSIFSLFQIVCAGFDLKYSLNFAISKYPAHLRTLILPIFDLLSTSNKCFHQLLILIYQIQTLTKLQKPLVPNSILLQCRSDSLTTFFSTLLTLILKSSNEISFPLMLPTSLMYY